MRKIMVSRIAALFLVSTVSWTANADSKFYDNLVELCQNTNVNSGAVSSTGCYQYIRGFLQGSVITDTAIINKIKGSEFESAFANRAYNTRVGNTRDSIQATSYAGFCLPNDQATNDVVIQLLKDVQSSLREQSEDEPTVPKRLYELLKARYSCSN